MEYTFKKLLVTSGCNKFRKKRREEKEGEDYFVCFAVILGKPNVFNYHCLGINIVVFVFQHIKKRSAKTSFECLLWKNSNMRWYLIPLLYVCEQVFYWRRTAYLTLRLTVSTFKGNQSEDEV